MASVQRLQKELSLKLDTGSSVQQDILQLRDPLGSLVIKALDDDQHPLAEQLQDLTALIDSHRAKTPALHRSKKQHPPSQNTPNKAIVSDAHFFMPQPGISLPVRRFWPLQLLLYETACSSHQNAVARCLGVDPEKIRYHVQQAHKISIGFWSVHQHGEHLRTALACLDYADPPIRLQGKMLMCGVKEIPLSSQQTAFVQLLMENSGMWVEHEKFHGRGIHNPVKIFFTLSKKIAAHEITVPIHSQAGAYMFTDVT